MKRFEFQLESVLMVRRQLEKQKQIELARVLKSVAEEEECLEDACGALEDARDSLRVSESGAIDIDAVRVQRVYIGALRKRIADIAHHISELETELATRRNDVVKASKDRKVLERLKDKRFAEYRYTMDRAEQATLDEVAARTGMTEIPA
jgi:flagellar FliJ protein